ncbi:unnamed protein product, partial [Strongylus vulgaris]
HIAAPRSGGHAIKIIGWGVTKNGTKYWTIANSWNVDWGEKDKLAQFLFWFFALTQSFFRMIRGENNCRIESLAKAGMMDV